MKTADISATSDIDVHLGDLVLREDSERLMEEMLKTVTYAHSCKKLG